MDQQLHDLYHRFVGPAFDRQIRFAEFQERKAPGGEWTFDPETANLSFGSKLRFEAPMVGSHADHNDSWLWSWANKQVKMSLTNRALGDTIRALAHRAMLPELARNGFPLEPLLGEELVPFAVHIFGSLLVGELDYDAYFVAPYDDGQHLLLLRDDRLRTREKHPLSRVLSIFPEMVAALPVPDPRLALASYAQSYALITVDDGNTMKISGVGNGELTATFDDAGRLKSLVGTGVVLPKPAAAAIPKKKKPMAKKKPASSTKAKPKKVTPTAKLKPNTKTKPTAKPKPPARKRPATTVKRKR